MTFIQINSLTEIHLTYKLIKVAKEILWPHTPGSSHFKEILLHPDQGIKGNTSLHPDLGTKGDLIRYKQIKASKEIP